MDGSCTSSLGARTLPRGIRPAIAAGAALWLLALAAVPAHGAQGPRRPAEVGGAYIVLLDTPSGKAAATTEALERRRGFRARHRYRRAVSGFSARLSDAQAARLREDPEVASVTPDRPVTAFGEVDVLAGDSAPAGVRRIGAAAAAKTREASIAGVAVIDSGIDLSHPDLYATHGVNCVAPGSPARDDHGHGTHVAGTIAARNDGRGVVGVAPGTTTYAVKVLDAEGRGTFSQLLCGIDWVTATRADADPSNDVAVANLSLGGTGDPVRPCGSTTDPLHRAICASTRAGVIYTVAAGNDAWDFDSPTVPDLPAAYPEVLSVTAISDSDGLPGAAGGPPRCRSGEGDDHYASFSNFAATSAGAAHTVAGPGVCVRSTWVGGGYATISGTSMAAPHLAGMVALCLGEGGLPGPCADLTPAATVEKVRDEAAARGRAAPGSGFTGDPACVVAGRYFGFLGWSGLAGGTASAEATGSAACTPPGEATPTPSPTAPEQPTTATPAPTAPGDASATPAPAAAWPGPAAPRADATAPAPAVSVPRQRLARVVRRGLRVNLRCSETCVATAEALLSGRTARRVRLSRGGRARIARRTGIRLAAGTRKRIVLRLSRSARRRLARVGRVTVTVRLSVRDAAGNRRSISRRASIRQR